ncbi:DUF2510 domain-containing protein [Nonomuraea sp. NPDC002799]
MTTQTPAGWYPDPYGEPQLRWWDGNQWTDATHAQEQGPGGPQQPASGPQRQPQSGPVGPAGPSGPSGASGGHDWSATPANPTLQFGQPTYGQPTYGQPSGGQPSGGQASGGQASGEQPAYGQPPSGGQPAYGQPPSGGQPAYGQPPSGGQPAYGQYGQPTGEQHAYGQPSVQWGGSPLPGPGYGPPPKQSNPLPWVFGGLAALVVVALIVVAGIFFINRSDSTEVASPSRPSDTFETQEPPSNEPLPSQPPGQSADLPKADGGRVTDPKAGVSFEVPDKWTVPRSAEINNGQPTEQQWSGGVQGISQQDYEGTNDWVGNVYTSVLNELYPYSGASGMSETAKTVFVDFSTRYYTLAHESKILQDKAMKIGDRDAWVLQFELDFTKVSEEKGYKWKKENGAIVLMDRGAGESPALVYVSVPDNMGTDVVGKVLSSLKPA